MNRTKYAIRYQLATMNGERGWWFRIWIGVRLIAEGWTRGRKSGAYIEARKVINELEAFHATAGAA